MELSTEGGSGEEVQGEDSHLQAEGRSRLPQARGAERPRPSPARGLPVSLLRRSLFAAFPLGLFLFLTDA